MNIDLTDIMKLIDLENKKNGKFTNYSVPTEGQFELEKTMSELFAGDDQ